MHINSIITKYNIKTIYNATHCTTKIHYLNRYTATMPQNIGATYHLRYQ